MYALTSYVCIYIHSIPRDQVRAFTNLSQVSLLYYCLIAWDLREFSLVGNFLWLLQIDCVTVKTVQMCPTLEHKIMNFG